MARSPRADPRQLDMFAARPLPAARAMEPRGSIALPLPLTAEQAILAHSGAVYVVGYRWQDGTTCCEQCLPVLERAGLDRGHGYRMSVYRTGYGELRRCIGCEVPLQGETGHEELQRRINRPSVPPPESRAPSPA